MNRLKQRAVLHLHNTLLRKVVPFVPIDPLSVGMYICGPTVYDAPHIGNGRSAVVYDVLYRLLGALYGLDHVRYVRNITDVDDKINAAAKQRGISIQALTTEITALFHEDMAYLGCLAPTMEPRATQHIDAICAMITCLLASGHAYAEAGHVYFDVTKDPHYGALADRTLESMRAGARVAVVEQKRHPGDFVLWKPAATGDDPSAMFPSPWGEGRPGWHIECSAMSTHYLGKDFDLHGGGADLLFPHHTNEIAQSCCAYPGTRYAHTWVHNGFVTHEGEKMSKSLGNVVAIRQLREAGWHTEMVRMALLRTHYRKPLDWNQKALEDAHKLLEAWYRALDRFFPNDTAWEAACAALSTEAAMLAALPEAMQAALCDDLNIPKLLGLLSLPKTSEQALHVLAAGRLVGVMLHAPRAWLKAHQEGRLSPGLLTTSASEESLPDAVWIQAEIAKRAQAKAAKQFSEADRIREHLATQGIILHDGIDGNTTWSQRPPSS